MMETEQNISDSDSCRSMPSPSHNWPHKRKILNDMFQSGIEGTEDLYVTIPRFVRTRFHHFVDTLELAGEW